MEDNGVVLYGAGKMAGTVINVLNNEGIHVLAVADKQVGKKLGELTSISLKDLCHRDCKEVCIVTPNITQVQDEIKTLKNVYPIVTDVVSIITPMLYYVPKYDDNMNYKFAYPFNHYESPYVSSDEICNNNNFMKNDDLLDIDLNLDFQKTFKNKLLQYRKEFYEMYEHSKDKFRFKTDNTWFDDSDATLLHAILREYHPKRVIEIGSGFSTCMMLDTNEYWLDNKTDITCIEPYPSRLYSNIKDTDNIEVHEDFVQNVPLSEFDVLEENDILFIDSSHVVKSGGDIPYEYFEILPRLKKGVLIHIHDIFSTFSYPTVWLQQGRPYSESFVLRALLMNSDRYEIVYFNNMMANKFKDEYIKSLCPYTGSEGIDSIKSASIWLRVKE
jgi:predicted O-methyltransferase YrrM